MAQNCRAVAVTLFLAFCSSQVAQGGKCPPRTICEGTKCAIDTCCKCEDWNPDGSCTEDGWTRTQGKGTCDFALGGDDECACPPKTTCQFQKTSSSGTKCECTCWDDEGLCLDDSWEVIEGDGDCDFEVDGSPPAPSPPSSGDQQCTCTPGIRCDKWKASGDGTLCECDCWDDEGKCLPDAWTVVEGDGDCSFEVPP